MRFVAILILLSSPARASDFYCGKDFITFTAAEAGEFGDLGEGRIATIRKSQVIYVLGPGKIGDMDGLGQVRIRPFEDGEHIDISGLVFVEESVRVKILECL